MELPIFKPLFKMADTGLTAPDSLVEQFKITNEEQVLLLNNSCPEALYKRIQALGFAAIIRTGDAIYTLHKIKKQKNE